MRPWLLTILCMLFLYTYAIQYYFASWVCWPYLCVVFHGSTPYVCCPSGLWLHKHAALVYICYPHLFCLIYILTTDGLPLLYVTPMHMPPTIAIPHAYVIYLYPCTAYLCYMHVWYCFCFMHMLTIYFQPLLLCCLMRMSSTIPFWLWLYCPNECILCTMAFMPIKISICLDLFHL